MMSMTTTMMFMVVIRETTRVIQAYINQRDDDRDDHDNDGDDSDGGSEHMHHHCHRSRHRHYHHRHHHHHRRLHYRHSHIPPHRNFHHCRQCTIVVIPITVVACLSQPRTCARNCTVGLPIGRTPQDPRGVATRHLCGRFGSPRTRGRRSRLYSVGWQRSLRPTIRSGPLPHCNHTSQPNQTNLFPRLHVQLASAQTPDAFARLVLFAAHSTGAYY